MELMRTVLHPHTCTHGVYMGVYMLLHPHMCIHGVCVSVHAVTPTHMCTCMILWVRTLLHTRLHVGSEWVHTCVWVDTLLHTYSLDVCSSVIDVHKGLMVLGLRDEN